MKTYKGTDKDMRCRGGFQYELGKTVVSDGAIRCGDKGFHLAGGDRSTLAGGEASMLVCRNGKARGGLNSVIVLTEWMWRNGKYVPATVKAEIVDGERIKADTWYWLDNGEFVEVADE